MGKRFCATCPPEVKHNPDELKEVSVKNDHTGYTHKLFMCEVCIKELETFKAKEKKNGT